MSHPEPSQPVQMTKGSSLSTSGGQTEGMTRQNAIVDKCAGICATRMLAKPHSASAVHHHGAQDTIVYAVRGRGSVVSEGGAKRVDLEAGDYALIPAFMEHQEVNDGDEDVEWTIVRSGRVPDVVNLTGWGGQPVEG
ncbi:RmlC-like cupin [Xylariomycetidae sp. FL0641]|nr:RmlC-like cupin [Xylariomycetidae sp. FL0641]